MVDKEIKVKSMITLEEVPTQFMKQIVLPNGEAVSFEDYLVWLGNQVLEIKKVLVADD